MRRKFSYTNNQLKEMDTFFNSCLSEKVDLDKYWDICEYAETFIENCKRSNLSVESSIALLSLSALISYRRDDINTIIKRDLNNTYSVRLDILTKKLKKE